MKTLINLVIPQVSAQWEYVGLSLLGKHEVSRIRMIKKDNASDPQRCCMEMLCYWLESCPDASWQNLIDALQDVELNAVAADIEKKILKGHYCTHVFIELIWGVSSSYHGG